MNLTRIISIEYNLKRYHNDLMIIEIELKMESTY